MNKFLLMLTIVFGLNANAQITLGTGTLQNEVPISVSHRYSYTQQIFSKDEINAAAAGDITGLKFYLPSNAVITNSSTWEVYLGHTSKITYTSNSDYILASSMTKVFEGDVVNNNGEVTVTFSAPFAYDNASNIVIAVNEIKQDSDAYAGRFYMYQGINSTTLRCTTNNNTVFNPAISNFANTRSNSKSRITFLGLTPANLSVSDTASSEKNIKIYPNPVNDIVNISDISKVKNISISDVVGRLVKSFDNPASDVNIKELQSGMYILTLNMNDGSKKTIKINKK